MLTVADTAFSIAVIRAEESALPAGDRLFEDPFAKFFADAGAQAAEGTARYLALPFFREGVRLRTRRIDDFVREALEAGSTQIVLLGAGFDARGLRMPEIERAGATVYEIDTAEQLERKRAILERAGVTVPPSIVAVPFDFGTADFEDALIAALVGRGFRASAGATFVWEGVIGYIDSAAIDRSLRFMARAGGKGSRLIYTSAADAFAPDSPEARLARCEFSSCEEVDFNQLWRRYLPGDPHENAWFLRIGVARV